MFWFVSPVKFVGFHLLLAVLGFSLIFSFSLLKTVSLFFSGAASVTSATATCPSGPAAPKCTTTRTRRPSRCRRISRSSTRLSPPSRPRSARGSSPRPTSRRSSRRPAATRVLPCSTRRNRFKTGSWSWLASLTTRRPWRRTWLTWGLKSLPRRTLLFLWWSQLKVKYSDCLDWDSPSIYCNFTP